MIKHVAASLMCVALVSGCSSLSSYYPGKSKTDGSILKEAPKPISSAPRAIESYPSPVGAVGDVRLRRRKFLIGDERIEPGYGAYGYVLFLKEARNDVSLKAKYIKICESYLDSFSEFATSENTPTTAKYLYFPTFWFLTRPVEGTCPKYVENYNYERARKIAEGAGLTYEEAPYLFAERFAGANSAKNKRFFIALRRISPDRIDETLNIWANRITSNTGAWERGWDLDIIRLQMASFVSTYGDSIYGVMR
ncbi:MAG: hypothetical protein V4525_07615 [Pseudomonadota bacterium]